MIGFCHPLLGGQYNRNSSSFCPRSKAANSRVEKASKLVCLLWPVQYILRMFVTCLNTWADLWESPSYDMWTCMFGHRYFGVSIWATRKETSIHLMPSFHPEGKKHPEAVVLLYKSRTLGRRPSEDLSLERWFFWVVCYYVHTCT